MPTLRASVTAGTQTEILEGAYGRESRCATPFLTSQATKWQYLHGVTDESLVDLRLRARFGPAGAAGKPRDQTESVPDYANNVALYPGFQEYSAPSSRRCWPCGARTTRSSCPREHTLSSAITRTPKCSLRHRSLRPRDPSEDIAAAITDFLGHGSPIDDPP